MNFVIFLRTPFFIEHLCLLLLASRTIGFSRPDNQDRVMDLICCVKANQNILLYHRFMYYIDT